MRVVRAGSGRSVLLAHSYLWTAEMWRPQIDALASRYSVIAPDLWGHGASGQLPPHTDSLRDIARHHLALLDALDIHRCTLVGLSVGGMWGAELALLAPERIEGIVLVDTYLGAEPNVKQAMYFAFLDAVEAIGAVTPALLDKITPLFFSPKTFRDRPHLPDAFRNALMSWSPNDIRDSVVPVSRMIFGRRNALADLAVLGARALVITGADDLARPPQEGRQMAERLSCPFIEIGGAGHISSPEEPDAVTKAIFDFMETEPKPR
jgi:pimeloyl-ACP methyl ester carboxylesterase